MHRSAEELLADFVALLLRENQRHNLTAARTATALRQQHIADSLALLPLLRQLNPRELLDLGTGGGLPGIPLACTCERLQVTLLDATRKKVDAVRRMVERLGLANVRCVCERAETLAHDPAYREQFDAVTARGVAELAVLVEYAAGFLRPGGAAWFFKSAAALGDEQTRAAVAADACRMEPLEPLRYRLHGDRTDRLIMGYRKTEPLAAHLPRRPGRARKRPL